MLAWEIARQWQEANCMTPFEEILGAHLSCGLVHSTPEVFLLAQECHWTGTEMISRRDAEVRGLPINAWFTELAAASETQLSGLMARPLLRIRYGRSQVSAIREFLRVATHPHEFVLWCRQTKGRKHDIHSYRWDHLARRVGLRFPSSIS